MRVSRSRRWWVQVVRADDAPVPWHDVVRSAVTVPAVMTVSYLLGGREPALFASLAALLVVLSERPGTTGQRLFKSASGLAAGTIAVLVGPVTGGTGLTPLLIVLALGTVSGVLHPLGQALSFAGMQLLVQAAIAGGLTFDLPMRDRVSYYLAGGTAAILVMILQSAFERTDAAYAEAVTAVGNTVMQWPQWHALTAPSGRTARWVTDAALEQARELILTARPVRSARRRLVSRARRDYDSVSTLVTDAVAGRTSVASASDRGAIPVSALLVQPLRARTTWTFVLRLDSCLAVGELARQMLPWQHGYWIILTIALSYRPDLAPVFARSAQRAIGTALGVLVGTVAIFVRPVYGAIPLLAVLGATIPWTVRRNYGWFTVAITPQVLLLLDLGHQVAPAVLGQRVVDTTIGALIAVAMAAVPDVSVKRVEAELAALRRRVGAASGEAEERLAIEVRLHELDVRCAERGTGSAFAHAHVWASMRAAIADVDAQLVDVVRGRRPDQGLDWASRRRS